MNCYWETESIWK